MSNKNLNDNIIHIILKLEKLLSKGKTLFFLAAFLIVSLVAFSIIRISKFISYETFPSFHLILYIISVIMYIIFSLVINRYIQTYRRDSYDKFLPHIRYSLTVLIYGNYISIALFIILTSQILLFNEYFISIMKSILYIAFIQTVIFIGILFYKFMSWSWYVKPNRGSLITWLYTFAIGMILLNCFFTVSYVTISLLLYSEIISYHTSAFLPFIASTDPIKVGFYSTLILAYISFWISTVIMLSNYEAKLFKLKFWVLSILPLLYFLLPFYNGTINILIDYFQAGTPLFAIIYTVTFSNNIPIAAIFFGLVFWSIGRKIENSYLRKNMWISGYAITLFFISNQSILVIDAPFPPLALPYIAVLGISGFLLMMGISYSSISFTQDHLLRKKIYSTIENEYVFIKNIGNPELEKQMIRKVQNISKTLLNEMEAHSGINTNLEGEELQNYISEVMSEIKQTKQ
jgi:hypothetical protein